MANHDWILLNFTMAMYQFQNIWFYHNNITAKSKNIFFKEKDFIS